MASDYRIINPATGVTIYLVNTAGRPLAGGSPFTPSTTPFGLRSLDWTPAAAPAQIEERGGPPLANGSDPAWLSYGTIDEKIPLVWQGAAGENVARAAQWLRDQFTGLYGQPALLYAKPAWALQPIYYEIWAKAVQEGPFKGLNSSPAEGTSIAAIDLSIRRRPFGGLANTETLISGATYTNQGTGSPDNDIALESSITVKGDLRFEGSPLNIRVDKPVAQSPIALWLASIHSKTYQAIASAKTTSTSTTFTASTAIDISAIRTRPALKLRVVGRLTTLTAPTNAQVRVTVQTASGNTLWVGPWVPLGSNTTAQLIDFYGTSLDAVRVPLANTTSVILQAEIKSISGSVTATLAYLEAILYYDWCVISCSAALAASQRLWLLSAQNLGGAGWLPMTQPAALITDASDAPVRTATLAGTPPRAYTGASLWAAWLDAGGAHTNTDTATITANHAPQYRSLPSVA